MSTIANKTFKKMHIWLGFSMSQMISNNTFY